MYNNGVLNFKEVPPMKRISLAFVAIIALLALTAPIVLADNNPGPPPTGGCDGGPNCK